MLPNLDVWTQPGVWIYFSKICAKVLWLVIGWCPWPLFLQASPPQSLGEGRAKRRSPRPHPHRRHELIGWSAAILTTYCKRTATRDTWSIIVTSRAWISRTWKWLKMITQRFYEYLIQNRMSDGPLSLLTHSVVSLLSCCQGDMPPCPQDSVSTFFSWGRKSIFVYVFVVSCCVPGQVLGRQTCWNWVNSTHTHTWGWLCGAIC